MKVSVCLIVRNEEENLPRALASIPRNYEIVVTDTGSTDNTKLIAERHGAVVHCMEWEDDFSMARNECASLATGDYILVMDADEELPPDTEEKVREFASAHPNSAGSVQILNMMGEERRRHRMVRFYPNLSGFAFHGVVHEQVYWNEEPAAFAEINLELKHYGYEDNEYEKKDKAQRYLSLYSKHLRENPHDGYMLYQAGKLYYSLGDLNQAELYLEAAHQANQMNRLYFPVMLVMLGYVLKEKGQSKRAEELLYAYKEHYPDFPDLFFLLGLLAMDTGSFMEIERNFLRAIKIGETAKYSSVLGVGSFKANYNLGVFYEVTGQTDKARQCYLRSSQQGYAPALDRLK